MFESCFVFLRTNALPGPAKEFMAVPAFKGLKASRQQIKLSPIFFNPSVPKWPEQARAGKLTASPQVTLPGASSLVYFVPVMHLESSFSQEILVVLFCTP